MNPVRVNLVVPTDAPLRGLGLIIRAAYRAAYESERAVTKQHLPLRSGQHVVITGGSSGLGLEVAHQLAPRGVILTLLARDLDKLEAARKEIVARRPDADVAIIAVDVADGVALNEAFTLSAARTGSLDVLVNCAGTVREGYFETLADDDYRAAMETNFFGTVNAIRAALPSLKESRGRIVNIASVGGLAGVFGFTAYCASKHALVGFTNSLRFELEPQGVTVQLVYPGEFDSPMTAALETTRTPENRVQTHAIPKIPAQQIAREIVKGIDAGTGDIVPGRWTRIFVTALRLAPGISSTVVRRRVAGVYQGPPRGH